MFPSCLRIVLRAALAGSIAIGLLAAASSADAQYFGYGRYVGGSYGMSYSRSSYLGTGYYGSGFNSGPGYYGSGYYGSRYYGSGYYGPRYYGSGYYGSGYYGSGYYAPRYYGSGYYGVGYGSALDLNYYAQPVDNGPAVTSAYTWQTNPFGVGYNLLTGYRPIYGGARQPSGHEVIWTGQNSYVYRPTYAPNTTSSRATWAGGPLVIDYPGTDQAKYYTSSGRVWEAQTEGAQPGMFTINDVSPPIPLDNSSAKVEVLKPATPQPAAPAPRNRGPREF
jgi:hypothetical protein